MVMRKIPIMKKTKYNINKTQEALDKINKILIGGIDKYNLNELKISKNKFNNKLTQIVKILLGGNKKKLKVSRKLKSKSKKRNKTYKRK